MPNPLIESFTIPITEWKTVDAGKKTIRIKGIALKGDVISKNNRHYIAKELKKATNTWIGKPVNVNHDATRNVGTIKWMDYDETADVLTYEAEITHEPYVGLLRNKSAEIRGVSIQADYLYNLCAKCQERGVEKRFYTEEDWRNHMETEHYLHDLPSQPHGIIGNGLSLVLSPEIPGYGGTSVELAEIARRETLRLLETVIKTEMESETYLSKVALKKEEKIAAGHKVITNPVDIIINPADVTRADILVLAPTQEEIAKSAPKIEEEIVTKKPSLTAEKTLVVNEHMKLGEPCSPELRACVDALIADGKEESSAWAICKSKLGETVVPSKTITLKEAVSIGKLVFKAKENQSFEDCIAEGNSPEECARRFKDTKEQNASNEMLVNVVNEIVDVVSKPIVLAMPEIKIPKDDTSWKQALEALPKDDLGWKELKIPEPYDDKPLKETIPKPYDDVPLKTKLVEMEDKLKEIPILKETISQSKAELVTAKEALKEIPVLKETINQLKEQVVEVPKLKETMSQQKKDFDSLLDAADKSVKEYFALNKKEMVDKDQKIKDLEEKLAKSIEENAKTKTIAETAKIEVENVSDKLKPEFKAKAKELKETKQKDSNWEP